VQARDLYQLLSTPDDGGALREAIAPAMPAYRRGLAEGGRSAPVVVECDGALLVIAAPHLTTLCEAFLAERIDEAELGYLATALDRAPDFRFVSVKVEEIAFLLSSGTASSEAVNAILRILREHAA
jgi:hypothetical protein